MCIATKIYTKLFGQYVGSDEFGNKYYTCKNTKDFFGREKRWVYYNGKPEASKVPCHWFIWLHHQTDSTPDAREYNSKRQKWKRMHIPNLTGTSGAYYPSGYALSKNKRDKATGDYEAWDPNSFH